MADVREMKAVGTVAKEVQQQLSSGYAAQGFALAQTVKAISVSVARDLRRCVETAFDYDVHAREACIKYLNEWVKECREAAKASGNLQSMGERSLGKVARSATVRASQFTTIMKAMDAGMNRGTLAEKAGVNDPENISFHVVVEIARMFLDTGATRQGRPADPFEVKLAKWLANQRVDGHDAEVKAKVEALLVDVLPHEEEEPVKVGRRSSDKHPALRAA